MRDLTKCEGDGCGQKERCLRFTMEPEPQYQKWFRETPGTYEICGYFINDVAKDKVEEDKVK